MRKSLAISLLPAIAVGAVMSLLVAYNAHAIQFSPLKVNYSGDKGETITDTLKVTNNFDVPVVIRPQAKDFTALPDDEKGIPNFNVPENYAFGLSDWITFDVSSKTLNPGESFELGYTIRIPNSASPGGHFGAILIGDRGELSDDSESSVGITSLTGPLLLVRVSGDVIEDGNILGFTLDKGTYSSLPVEMTTRFRNDGTVHLQPIGSVTITNMWGKEVANLSFNDNLGNVLPGSTRSYSNTWQKADLADDAPELVKEWRNFGFGPYRAELLLSYGVGNVSQDAAANFWVIPWQIIILLIIAIIVLILLLRSYNRAVVRGASRGKKK